MPKKPVKKSFPPVDDTLKTGARPAGKVLKSPASNKCKPKMK